MYNALLSAHLCFFLLCSLLSHVQTAFSSCCFNLSFPLLFSCCFSFRAAFTLYYHFRDIPISQLNRSQFALNCFTSICFGQTTALSLPFRTPSLCFAILFRRPPLSSKCFRRPIWSDKSLALKSISSTNSLFRYVATSSTRSLPSPRQVVITIHVDCCSVVTLSWLLPNIYHYSRIPPQMYYQ